MRVVVERLADHTVQTRVLALTPVRIVDAAATTDRPRLHSSAVDLSDRQRDSGLGDPCRRGDWASQVRIGHCRTSLGQFIADRDRLVVDGSLGDDQVGQQLEHLCGNSKGTKRSSGGHDSLEHRW